MVQASKGVSLVYKYLSDNSIAFKNDYQKFNANYFKIIKNACRRYECIRDQIKMADGSKNTNYNSIYSANWYNNSYSTIDMIQNADDILKKAALFKDYDNVMFNIARSILEYNSDKFINYISRYSITPSDIEEFLNIINTVKKDGSIDIRLLYSSSELIDQFYNLSIKCKQYFGYGNFKTVINKLEQLYMFESEKFENLLNNKRY